MCSGLPQSPHKDEEAQTACEGQSRDPKDEETLYLKERRALVDGESHSCTTFDKYVFPVAAAALGFSMTFIKEVVGTSEPRWEFMLVLAWFSFAVALISTLWSFRFSASAHSRQCDIIDAAYREHRTIKDAQGTNLWEAGVRIANWVSCVAMSVGVFSLLVFVVTNMEV